PSHRNLFECPTRRRNGAVAPTPDPRIDSQHARELTTADRNLPGARQGRRVQHLSVCGHPADDRAAHTKTASHARAPFPGAAPLPIPYRQACETRLTVRNSRVPALELSIPAKCTAALDVDRQFDHARRPLTPSSRQQRAVRRATVTIAVVAIVAELAFIDPTV